MAIPDFQSLMIPLLRLCRDGKEHAASEAVNVLADEFKLTDADRKKLLPSGVQEVFVNRVAWAKSHMKMAGLLETPRRGFFNITPRGSKVLEENPAASSIRFIYKTPEYLAYKNKRKSQLEPEVPDESENGSATTPDESLENAYQKILQDLASDLLHRLKSCSPSFFERLVVAVIVKMGYGGTMQDAGKAIGKSGDGGIDGIIKEDKLGLDTIYIQAKRWDATVGRPEIQKFVGALTGQRARKGLFITTSDFSKEAVEYVSRIEMKIVLIDGETLAQLMIDHNVGVSTVAAYELKKIDSDYFTEK